MIPVVRAFTSIVAGLIEMPLARFAVLSLIGTVVYVSALSTLGYAVGSAWHSVAHDVSIVGYIVVVLGGRDRRIHRHSAACLPPGSGRPGRRSGGPRYRPASQGSPSAGRRVPKDERPDGR